MSTDSKAQPRERLDQLREKMRQLPPLSPGARLALLAIGWFLILLGIAGLVLPGLQGVLTLVFGAAVLSLVDRRILAFLRRIFRRWPKGWRLLLRLRRRVHGWFHREAG